MDEPYPEGFDTDPTSPGFVPGEEVDVVPLDEPSMEDYPTRPTRCWCIGPECDGHKSETEFCFAERQKPPTVRDGVKDTKS